MENEYDKPESEGKKPMSKEKGSLNNPIIWISLAVIAILVVAFIGFGAMKKVSTFNDDVKTEQFQAVFLTNGQVYFGKIDSQNVQTIKLVNIYYLQVQQDVQPADAEAAGQNLSLAKLGKELHGPEDAMYLQKDQVLFWENMKNDSQVVKAIKEDKDK